MRKFLFALPLLGLVACNGAVPPVVVTGCADVSALSGILALASPVLGAAAPAVLAVEALLNAGCASAPAIAQAIANLEAALKAVGAVNHAAAVAKMVR